ncbi:MAG: hypothetical protein R3B06_03055 [Kofleriaceae bacterium]
MEDRGELRKVPELRRSLWVLHGWLTGIGGAVVLGFVVLAWPKGPGVEKAAQALALVLLAGLYVIGALVATAWVAARVAARREGRGVARASGRRCLWGAAAVGVAVVIAAWVMG